MEVQQREIVNRPIVRIAEGECFIYESDYYIRASQKGSLTDEIMKLLLDEDIEERIIAVRFSDGHLMAFDKTCYVEQAHLMVKQK